ncbi:MAG: nucleotidyltransferase domain-containing protein [Eudoraea sp.]|nr:nucleotidyltransferase domain-containing protein [Eudoraea sp.]MBT8209879.1 nucleotidyltransferase domain-containing protein [Eudoraea sp.]MBT8223521.1 nucleotidyltransferase domain-containing protein [Eudoraea sp.]
MLNDKFEQILGLLDNFTGLNPGILAIGLCGSRARGTARQDSDIDLSILVKDKQAFKETNWLKQLEFENIHDKLASFEDRTYGRVWSRHVFLESQTEIEFSFADSSWANIENLDDGTRKVVSDGYKILYDPHQILEKLVNKVQSLT